MKISIRRKTIMAKQYIQEIQIVHGDGIQKFDEGHRMDSAYLKFSQLISN